MERAPIPFTGLRLIQKWRGCNKMNAKKPFGQNQLLREISEQPEVVARLLERQGAIVQKVAKLLRQRAPHLIALVARGSSDNAATYARYLFEIRNCIATSMAAPSAVTLYNRGPQLSNAVVIAVSQSGQGEDVNSYLQKAGAQGAMTVAVVNDAASPLASNAEWVLECLAGPEISVPATKTVIAQMTLLALLSTAMDGDDAAVASLNALPAAIDKALSLRGAARVLAEGISTSGAVFVIGRGFAYPPALEIALKLKETSLTHAEPFSAADFFHGPVALVDPDYSALLVDVGGYSSRPAREMAEAVSNKGGKAFLLRASEAATPGTGVPALELDIPVSEPFAPIVAVVLGQLVAVELALLRGVDPVHPRGLKKVTSTR